MAAEKGNKYAEGNPGKPKKFKNKQEMQAAIDSYYDKCKENKEPRTIEGLCLALDIERQTLLNYEKREGYEEYFDTVKRAKLEVQDDLIKRGLTGANNPTLTIFLLKNNHGYKDRSESDNNNVKININVIDPKIADEIEKL